MANALDSTQLISIGITSQGFANVGTPTATPNPVEYGLNSNVSVSITNNGASDKMYAEYWINGVHYLAGDATVDPLGAGQTWTVPGITVLNITAQTTVQVRGGHYIGTTKSSPDSTNSVIIYVEGKAAFQGAVTFPASVEPGTDANILYTVRNDGDSDELWGGLFDATNTLVSGTYWTMVVAKNGTTGQITITIPAAQLPIVNFQLKIGHIIPG